MIMSQSKIQKFRYLKKETFLLQIKKLSYFKGYNIAKNSFPVGVAFN